MRTRRIWVAAAGTVVGMVVLPLAAAWACTSLATLNVTPQAGMSGQNITAVGNGFGRGATNSPVEVRWNSSNGPLLATVAVSSTGTINFSFLAPAGEPGYYTIIASQKNAAGNPVGGTPARATFALNNPPPQNIAGAGGALTVDQQAAIDTPPSVAFSGALPAPEETVVVQPAPVPAAAQQPVVAPQAAVTPPPAQPQAVVAPTQPLAPIAPSDARARELLAPGGADSFLGGPGLALVLVGALALAVAAVAAAVAPRRATAVVRRARR